MNTMTNPLLDFADLPLFDAVAPDHVEAAALRRRANSNTRPGLCGARRTSGPPSQSSVTSMFSSVRSCERGGQAA